MMNSIDKLLSQITIRLVSEFKPERIYLFGSHVWGRPDRNSDLDLLIIVKDSKLSPARRASLAYRCLRDIPYPLDIMVRTRTEMKKYLKVPATLEYKILNHGKLLYG
jgi:predicted nucleotidyltransferase